MSSRTVKEWVATTPDASIPSRVKRRILDRQDWKCASTKADLRHGAKFEFDHITALINGGEHREANLSAVLAIVHKAKTKQDVAEKSAMADKVKHHYGLNSPPARPLPAHRGSHVKATVGGGTKPREKPPSRHSDHLKRRSLYDDIQERT